MQKIIAAFDRFATRYTPDPLAIAIFLSAFVFIADTLHSGSIYKPLEAWGDGFWKLLKFTLQMSMILLGGYLVATAPAVNKLLVKLASKIKDPTQAIIATTLLSCFTSWLNWGFGLVVSAVFALEVGKRLKNINYRLLVATSYSGFIVWHGGLSGSIPLLLNSENNFSYELLNRKFPLEETIFSGLNLVILLSVVISLVTLNLIFNTYSKSQEAHLHVTEDISNEVEIKTTADKINHSFWVVALAAFLGFSALVYKISQEGLRVDLNNINYLLFFLALILQKNVHNFMEAVTKGAKKLGPILVQYPFYAGIMAILVNNGLAGEISELFISISNATTLPFFTFLSAGFVNVLVPSGGGQWAVQGPIVIPAALELNADMSKTVLAVAWGDAWTNLLQPFWALPLLAIANLKIKDILGFCLLNLLVTGVVISFCFLL